ncbi:hypothetical protein [Paracoccus homiensis]|uniref:Uncharacterized protein n=1 Tax=Paracoccus homiensis TaxID=364199 RepID=A0A1I0IZC8_9RHOB|nr:hypothetical protein [Paracoccus homiensis]SEU02728.1 hypothetical protein SAMN04489858_12032 [Paracoccus homiensis]
MSAPASYIATERGLREGLGVEDIAYRSGHPVELIRRHVTAMRRNGVLARMFGASE